MDRIPNTSDDTENLEQSVVLAKKLDKPVLTILDGEIEKSQALESELAVAEKIEKLKSDIRAVSDNPTVSKSSTAVQSTRQLPPNTENRENKSRGFVDTLKDQGHLFGMRLKGIENPKVVLDFAHYLEENVLLKKTVYISVKENELAKKTAELQMKGYKTQSDDKPYDGQVSIWGRKDAPYKFKIRDARHLEGLRHSKNDPVKVLNSLRSLGYQISDEDLLSDGLKSLADTPHVVDLMRTLQRADFKGSYLFYSATPKDTQEAQILAGLASDITEGRIISEPAIQNLATIASVFKKPLNINSIQDWLKIAISDDLANLLKVAAEKGIKFENDPNYWSKDFQEIIDSGIAGSMVKLINEGFDLKGLGLSDDFYPNRIINSAENIKDVVGHESLYYFIRQASAIIGLAPNIELRQLEQFKKLYEYPEAIDMLHIAVECGAIEREKWSNGWYYKEEIDRMFSNKELLGVIHEPEFREFMSAMRLAGCEVTSNDLFKSGSRFVESYLDENFRTKIIKKENIDLANRLEFFKGYDWKSFHLERIIDIPDASEYIKKIEELYDYRYDAQSNFYDLAGLLENRSLMEKLFNPETVGAYKRLKDQLERNSVGFGTNSNIIQNAITLASYDPALYPTLEFIMKEYDYAFVPRDHENELAILQSNPELLKAAMKLKLLGITIDPLQNWRLIDPLIEHNLFPLLEKYKDLKQVNDFIISNAEQIVQIPPEEIQKYVDAFQKMNELAGFRDHNQMDLLRTIIDHDLLSIIDSYGDKQTKNFIMSNANRMTELPRENIPAYIDIFQKIDESPSQEIQRMKEPLLSQLLKSENPTENYHEIESIFIKNNIPLIGKTFGVFEVLHDSLKLKNKISGREISPVLKSAGGTKSQFYTIYKDLLDIHIKSGNRSLRDYAKILQDGAELLDKYEEEGISELKPDEQERLRYFIGKLETLLSKSALDSADDAFDLADSSDLRERLEHIRESMKVAEGQTLTQRISDMYLKPLRIPNLETLLDKMQESTSSADKRSRSIVNSGIVNTDGTFLTLKEGDFLKGIDDQFIANILQNGSVAKEFLGASSDSDLTPLDTDISLVMEGQDSNFSTAINTSMAKEFGNVLFAIKDRGQFQRTELDVKTKAQPGKFELFKTRSEQHYGIRTGLPSTEIDFLIVQEAITSNPRRLQDIFFEIAKNGFYIPVTDMTGKVIYTPEMFDEFRKSFAGIEKYGGGDLEIVSLNPAQKSYDEMSHIRQSVEETAKHTDEILGIIRNSLNQALGNLGVALRPKYDTSIVGAEFIDTGSSGRHTNLPGDFDFDFSLKLDAEDFTRAAELAQAIKATMVMEKDDSSAQENGYYQLRAKGVTEIGGVHLDKSIDIDIGFARKSDLSVYGSHDAVRDKLNYTKEHNGEDTYQEVISNITLAKKILKEGKAYKKLDHGGLGGIGVENWILANGGNIEEAFKSFRDAAYDNGKRLPYDEFKKKYRIIDPGINIKFLKHDNFIEILKPDGYEAMLDVIEKHIEG